MLLRRLRFPRFLFNFMEIARARDRNTSKRENLVTSDSRAIADFALRRSTFLNFLSRVSCFLEIFARATRIFTRRGGGEGERGQINGRALTRVRFARTFQTRRNTTLELEMEKTAVREGGRCVPVPGITASKPLRRST